MYKLWPGGRGRQVSGPGWIDRSKLYSIAMIISQDSKDFDNKYFALKVSHKSLYSSRFRTAKRNQYIFSLIRHVQKKLINLWKEMNIKVEKKYFH